jgi:metal-responsive CopG/Arc/MetJ family transcriptional regulator
MKDRTVISISMPKIMARKIAQAQKTIGLTRSEFFRLIVRRQLEELDLTKLAGQSGSFDFLKSEPELYSIKDIKK